MNQNFVLFPQVINAAKENAGNRDIICAGCGNQGEFFLKANDFMKEIGAQFLEPKFFCDTRVAHIGRFHDLPVLAPSALDKSKHYVIVTSGRFAEDISGGLQSAGFEAVKDYAITVPLESDFHDIEYHGVKVGKFTYGYKHIIDGGGELKSIGRFTSIAATAQVEVDHPMSWLTTSILGRVIMPSREMISSIRHDNSLVIGNDVWIGANAFINASKCHHIGDGAIIGAGAIVTHDVEPYAIVVGTPARLVRYRFPLEKIELLRQIKWWEYDNKTLFNNLDVFYNPEEFFRRCKEKAEAVDGAYRDILT
ncbi:MAG: CatB-related O-acetyltransferase [Treponema sp.]|nr:CatB-related O-acetyltransferase [Treponema sp.]